MDNNGLIDSLSKIAWFLELVLKNDFHEIPTFTRIP